MLLCMLCKEQCPDLILQYCHDPGFEKFEARGNDKPVSCKMFLHFLGDGLAQQPFSKPNCQHQHQHKHR